MYFDYAATSIKRKNIIKNLIDNIDLYDANPSSTHNLGKKSKIHLENARKIIAQYLNASPTNVYFTSGASESNNTVLENFNNRNIHIISTNIEHKSILEKLKYMTSEYVLINAKQNGRIDVKDVLNSINENTKLVTIMYVNNETGIIQPIEEIGRYLKEKDIWFHVDAVQALGHIDIDVEKCHIDSMSLSGHKLGGLNGFGVLYLRTNISNLIYGGSQEHGQRAGTSNVLAALSMSKSIPEVINERDYISYLKNYFLKSLKDIPHEINGDINFSSNHIVNIYFPFVKSDLLLTYLDMNGVYVSAGSACNANTLQPSYVIENMYDVNRANHSVRFSFGFTNTTNDIDYMISKIREMYIRKVKN